MNHNMANQLAQDVVKAHTDLLGRPRNAGRLFAILIFHAALCVMSVAHGQTEQWDWKFLRIVRETPSGPFLISEGPSTPFASKAAALAALRNAYAPESRTLAIEHIVDSDVSRITYSYRAPRTDPIYTPWVYGLERFATEEEAVAQAREDAYFSNCPGAQMVEAGDWEHIPGTPPYPWGNQHEHKSYQVTGACIFPYDFVVSIERLRSISCPFGMHFFNEAPFCGSNMIGYIQGQLVECDGTGPPSLEGNPCDVISGEKYESETDYSSAGLSFERYYHSITLPESTGIGKGWTHNYAGRLWLRPSARFPHALVRPDGYQERLNHHGGLDGYSLAASGSGTRITAEPDGGLLATLRDGTKEYYDATGRLLRRVSVSGLSTTLVYESGRLTSVVGPHGHTLTFEYAAGQLSRVIDPDNRTIAYSYDSAGNLSGVEYPDGTTRIYHYEDAAFPNHLTGITSENGLRYSTYSYDGRGRVTSSEHANGAQRITLAYGATTTTVTDSLLGTTTYNLSLDSSTNGTRRVVGKIRNGLTQTFQRDTGEQRRVLQETDARGIATRFAYNELHPTSVTEAYGTPHARTKTMQWHSTYRLPMQIDEPGKRTTYTHDASGNVRTKTELDTTTGTSRTWTYDYNSYGQVLSANGPRTDVSDVTTYTYYNCTTGARCGQIETIRNALDHVTTYNTYNSHGQPLTITDPNSVVTTLTYDLRQRLTSRTVGGEQTTFEYWPTGLLKKATLPDGSYLEYTYDAAHQLTGINDAEGNRIAYTLDAMGNRTAENAYDPSNALSRTRTRVFNTLNQLWKEIGAAGTAAVTTEFGYDNNGNHTSINAPLGRNTTQTYDELNRLKHVTDPRLGTTQYGYDPLDQLISVTDPGNLTTGYTYNALGDLLEQVSPDTGTTAFTYDSGGNLETKTDARGSGVGRGTYSHDALNRVTQIQYPDHTISYVYDMCLNGKGRLCSMTDASGSTSYEYDAQGRVTRKVQTVHRPPGWSPQTREVRYAYTNGRLTQLTMPSGHQVNYSYDGAGRISALSLTWAYGGPVVPLLSNVLYDAFGGVRGWTWANGTLAVREYDPDGRVTTVDSAGLTSLTYDDAGRIREATTDGNAPSWSYDYDSLDRLTSAARTGLNRAYTYDANGNRRTQGGTESATFNYSNPLTSNRLAGISGSLTRSYSYDASGNVTGDGLRTFTYDGAGRMRTAGTTEYFHNGLGQRVIKRLWSGNEYSYLYDEAGHVLEECEGWINNLCSDWTTQQFIWLGDIPVATILQTVYYNWEGYVDYKQMELFNVHTDHLNTPRKLTRSDSSNTLVWRWDSDPFGVGAANGNLDGDEHSYPFDLRFPGQAFDQETGLHYNYYRDAYEPVTGRYTQSDPVGLQGGVNTYAYAMSNPVSRFDPDGLEVRYVCRPLEQAGFRSFNHCYVVVTCPEEGWSNIYSLFPTGGILPSRGRRHLGVPGTAGLSDNYPAPNSRADVPIIPQRWPDNPQSCERCQFEKAVRDRFYSFPSGDMFYDYRGPNSNSFSNGLLDLPDWGVTAPGVDSAPGQDLGWDFWGVPRTPSLWPQ